MTERRLFAVAGAVFAIEVTTHLVDVFVLDSRVRLLDSAREWSYSHLLGTLAFAAGAILGVLGVRGAVAQRAAWRAIAWLFAFLLVDNVTRLHTHVPGWPLLYGPVLLVLCWALLRVADGSRVQTVMRAGVTLLVLSLAIHVIGPPIERLAGWGEDSWGTQLKIALKEGTELAGWALVVPSLLLLRRRATRTGSALGRRSGGHRPASALQDEPGELVDEPRVAVKPPERRTA